MKNKKSGKQMSEALHKTLIVTFAGLVILLLLVKTVFL